MATKFDIVSAPAHRPAPEPGVWSRLPSHLLELVLSHFPLSSLLALRSTCKYFHSLTSSSSFLSLLRECSYSHNSSPLSYFLLSHPQLPQHSFFLFDPRLSSWRRLAVPNIAGRRLISSYDALLSSFNGLLVVWQNLNPTSKVLWEWEEFFLYIRTPPPLSFFIPKHCHSSFIGKLFFLPL